MRALRRSQRCALVESSRHVSATVFSAPVRVLFLLRLWHPFHLPCASDRWRLWTTASQRALWLGGGAPASREYRCQGVLKIRTPHRQRWSDVEGVEDPSVCRVAWFSGLFLGENWSWTCISQCLLQSPRSEMISLSRSCGSDVVCATYENQF